MSQVDGTSAAIGDGLRRLIELTGQSLDKSPVLHDIFDRLAATATESLRAVCSKSCTLTLNGMTSGNALDLLAAYQDGFGAIFRSTEWDARTVFGCDHRFGFSIIEAMFGADGTEAPYESDRRVTALEARLLREIALTIAELLRQQLLPICQADFIFEQTDNALDCSKIGLSDEPALMVRFESQAMDGGGNFFVLLPNAALAPFRNRREQDRSSGSRALDPVWSESMQRELGRAEVDIQATLEGPQLTLSELGYLRPGRVLVLTSTAQAPVALEVEEQVLFMAKLGQSKGVFTVCIERRLDEREELLSGILGGVNV